MASSAQALLIKVKKIPMILKRKTIRFISKIRASIMRCFRNIVRDNSYEFPKRLLIYTIFESEKHLQEYKVLFLEGLLPFADRVEIVVNGTLPENDLKRLAKYGNVQQRENKGYDAGAFQFGILSLSYQELQQFDQLLLVNDTNIGPLSDLAEVFKRMDSKKLDFWGMSFGEVQPDFTGMNPYGFIPEHLQSYFLVIEHSLLKDKLFYHYWQNLPDTSSRNAAIGRHETVFTRYFSNRGYVYDAVVKEGTDSPIYIHPLRAIRDGMPLVKYSALANFDDHQFLWQELERQSEIPELLKYIEEETDFPVHILEDIIQKYKTSSKTKNQILIIDGVENIIPQCTRYRVLNKAEQLKQQGYDVKVVNHSSFIIPDAKHADIVIIYRATKSEKLLKLISIMKKLGRKVYYDIDDLVFDTKYTDQLEYTQSLSKKEKASYDAAVQQYGDMLGRCDAVITSTDHLKTELEKKKSEVIIHRNVLSKKLIHLSNKAISKKITDETIKIAYFSGSITHNENFEMIKPALIKILEKFKNVELHLAGHLDIPADIEKFGNQIVVHPYVDWEELPDLIGQMDINLAPLKQTLFNEAKSEIKWLEAATVKVVTVASNIGSFKEMIKDGETGVLALPEQWYNKLEELVVNEQYRNQMAEQAYQFVLANCTTSTVRADI